MPSSFGEVTPLSAIQLLLENDRAFAIRSTTLVGAIGRLRRRMRFVHDRRCNSIITPYCFFMFVHDRRWNSIMTSYCFLGFVHDKRCNSIMTRCCFLGFIHDRWCNSIMTPYCFFVHFAFICSLFQVYVISTNLLLVIFIYRTMLVQSSTPRSTFW